MNRFSVLFLVFVSALQVVSAQIPDNIPVTRQQELQIAQELARRNITQAELNARLLQKGINIAEIPPEELPNYQAIIIDTVNELEAEKRAAAQAQSETVVAPQAVIAGPTEPVQPDRPADTVFVSEPEPVSEEEERVMIYGHEPFKVKEMGIFNTTEGARAPDTYILGPGDQIRITIFGASQTDLLLEINEEGYIRPSDIPQIYLKGLSIAQARNLLRERLTQFYTFRADQFALTIHTARTITINVFGEAEIKGSFNVSALNTAFNAIAVAGGPTEIGSVRNIQHIRGTTRKTLDVYEFMNDPTVQFNFDLQHNDIIYIPVARNIVRITGSVKRPKRYELKAGETLSDLIEYAGGINYNTYPDYVQIERIENGEVTLREWSLADVLRGDARINMMDGDVIRLRPVERPLERFAEISGAVFYGGRYDLRQNPTLRSLIERAEPTPNARLDRVFIDRTLQDESRVIIPFEYEEARRRFEDFELQRRDRVIVFDEERYANSATLEVVGHVRNPFERTLSYGARLRLDNAIDFAGGLQPSAADTAFVMRRDLFNRELVQVLRVNIRQQPDFMLGPGDVLTIYDRERYTDSEIIYVNGAVRTPRELRLPYGETISLADFLLMADGLLPTAYETGYVVRTNLMNPNFVEYIAVNLLNDKNFQLMPGDRLNVYTQSTYTNIPQISVQGAVNNSISTKFEPNLTVTDLLKMAGGFTETAAMNRVDIFRLQISERDGTRFSRISVEVDSSLNLLGQWANFRLQPFDQIVVRQIPMFNLERTVQINGEVLYPGVYLLESRRIHLSELISETGGLTGQADTRHATLFRTYGNLGPVGIDLKNALNNRKRENYDPVVLEGDIITIPKFQNTISIRIEATVLGNLVQREVIAGDEFLPDDVDDRVNFVYQGKRSARWYIVNYAGGFANDADKRSVTVTTPSGKVKGTKSRLFVFNKYPKVEAGSTIALTFEPPKPERTEPRIDIDRLTQRTMATTTSILTLIIMLDRLMP